MPQSLRTTWVAVLLATLAVVVAGFFTVRTFVQDVFVPCRGSLQVVSDDEIAADRLESVYLHEADLVIRYDEVPGKAGRPPTYKNLRVAWSRGDDDCACRDAKILFTGIPSYDRPEPSQLRLMRDPETGVYVVTSTLPVPVVAFRKVEGAGQRFMPDRAASGKHAPLLVFLASLGALAVAAFRAVRATPYATRMHAWRPATLRPDGLVESETGATLGRIEERARVRAGAVLVDPAALEGRDVYREVPMLSRREVAPGSHERWVAGTMRRLRDARSLAIVSTVTTVIALASHVAWG